VGVQAQEVADSLLGHGVQTPLTAAKRQLSGSDASDRMKTALTAVSKTLFDDEEIETDLSSSSM
jgi:hypothetical protein